MPSTRPYVLTIAGFDPSGGAGVLADCKTFEQHAVYGFGVSTCLTVQTDDQFLNVHWLSTAQIVEQLQPLLNRFTIAACKIGVIGLPQTLLTIIDVLRQYNPALPIVWDPVLKASAGYDFHAANSFADLETILAAVTLVTPNYNELQQLQSLLGRPLIQQEQAAYCAVLLKGGHRPDVLGTDTLYESTGHTIMPAGVEQAWPKHGSGCVLAAAITAQLALGHSLQQSCRLAKQYVETFLNSNASLLGYHSIC